MVNFLRNKKILITGGTGSIGSELVKQILKQGCKTIRVLSNDENGLHDLSLNLKENSNFFDGMKKNKIRYFYGDVTDYQRMISACEDIDIVVHAAAMKHVPICEYNPFEATKVNVIGTENMLKASLSNKVEKFILISTDKVVDPTTCLGATKLLAEKITLNSNLNKGNKKTIFSVVRFGNVIGTRGSVLPKFIYQLKNNLKITLTSEKTTRFFVSTKDSVNCIINSILMMKGGEIFVPKSINSIKIYDLAIALKKHYTLSKSKLIKIGLRSGEKNHEKIITESEYSNLKYYKNFFIIDKLNRHRITKVKKKIYYFDSSKAKLMKDNEIIKYLRDNFLL
tara:strand:+ start:1415 stop:2428 length:1014 start_codon:yes stop_codon:yes gene_type:complete